MAFRSQLRAVALMTLGTTLVACASTQKLAFLQGDPEPHVRLHVDWQASTGPVPIVTRRSYGPDAETGEERAVREVVEPRSPVGVTAERVAKRSVRVRLVALDPSDLFFEPTTRSLMVGERTGGLPSRSTRKLEDDRGDGAKLRVLHGLFPRIAYADRPAPHAVPVASARLDREPGARLFERLVSRAQPQLQLDYRGEVSVGPLEFRRDGTPVSFIASVDVTGTGDGFIADPVIATCRDGLRIALTPGQERLEIRFEHDDLARPFPLVSGSVLGRQFGAPITLQAPLQHRQQFVTHVDWSACPCTVICFGAIVPDSRKVWVAAVEIR